MLANIKIQGLDLEVYVRLDGLTLIKVGSGKYHPLLKALEIIQEHLEYKEGNIMCNGVYFNMYGCYSGGSSVPSRSKLKEEIEAAIAVAISWK